MWNEELWSDADIRIVCLLLAAMTVIMLVLRGNFPRKAYTRVCKGGFHNTARKCVVRTKQNIPIFLQFGVHLWWMSEREVR